MTREEKIKLAIIKGITYNPDNGKVYGVRGSEIKRKIDGYININITHLGKDYKLKAHQFAYYLVYGKVVDCIDHINNIRDDNRIDNLRSITKQQNGFNTKSKGYSYNKKLSKYRAYITIDKKQIHLGYFNIEEEARQAYTDAKKIYHII
jgi:hypothetical protein